MHFYLQMKIFLFLIICFVLKGESTFGRNIKDDDNLTKTKLDLILAQADTTDDVEDNTDEADESSGDELDIEAELSNLDDDLDDFDQEAEDEFEEDLASDLEGELQEESADLLEEDLIDQEVSESEQDEILLEEEFEAETEQAESTEDLPVEEEQVSPPETISVDEGLAETEDETLTPPLESVGPVEITGVDFLHDRSGGTIVIKTTGTPPTPFTRRSEDGRQIIIELSNTKLPDQFKRPYATREFPSNIGFFQAYQDSQSSTARFVVQIREPTEPLVRLDGNAVLIEAQGPGPVQNLAEIEEPSATDEAFPTDTEGVTDTDIETDIADEDAQVSSSGPLDASTSEDLLSKNLKFTGHPISIEVNNANIRDVLEFIANDSGLNLILSDAVSGTVSLKLRDIPWDQAFLVVLQTKKLGYIKNRNILMVDTVSAIRTEIQERKTLLDSKKNLEPLQIQIIPISYAKASELISQIQVFKSERGQIQSDERTNSLIVTDISESIERMKQLIKTLDIQIPQVLIEGKIIEANETFNRRFGLALTGKNLGATINSITVPSSGGGRYTLDFDLREIVGLSSGTLTGIFDILEEDNVIKVLSSPRVVTLNNLPASINQTEQIPISQSNATAGSITSGTEYKNLNFSLQVTPQVTSGEGIIMQINIQREFAGPPSSPDASPPVHGRSANTTVLVNNGDTAVIGGMYQTNSTQELSGIPILKDLPLIGALFRQNFYETSKSELLIFLTPRVLNRSGSLISSNTNNNINDITDEFENLDESLDEVELEQEFETF